MSLLRACRARPTLNALVHARGLTTDAPTQTQLAPKKSESTQIAEPVHGEILTADVVSGAPGIYLRRNRHRVGMLIVHP
jgi:NADH dehydrogenase (ubiquinone) Fe-S protein 4